MSGTILPLGRSERLNCCLAALRHQLGDDFHFDFLDGEHPWPAANGICEAFGDQQICYSYFDGSTRSVIKAVDDLADYVRDNGPFDAVMGFSLGAALVATLLVRDTKPVPSLRIGCAIFLCGTLPCDWHELGQGSMQLLLAKDVGNVIQIPTVHAWSPNDVDYPGQSAQLFQMCEATKRVEVLHGGGHSVPSQGVELVALAEAIQRTLPRLER